MEQSDPFLVLQAFYELVESRCSLKLKNGEALEGYLLELCPDYIVWGEGGPLASEEDRCIALEEIDLDNLSYYCRRSKTYLDFRRG